MKISALEISQFMRVDCVSMTFAPSGAITIAGDNGSGKTSVETFIELCFGGKDKCPAMPVKIGAKKALGKLTLDDEGHAVTIEVEIGPEREVKAVVRQDGGKPFDGPITMLKKLVSRFTFNPFALMKLTGQEQRKTMLDCLGVNFDDLEAQAEKIKAERKEVGRDRNGRERQIASMPEHVGVPAEEVKMADIATDLQNAVAHNAKCKKFHDAVTEWEHEQTDASDQLKALQAQVKACETRCKAAEAGLAKAKADAAKLTPIDTAPIQKKLSEADSVNAKVRENKARNALVEQYQQDHARYEELGEELAGIEKAKQDRLNAAKCPVEGLEFRDEGIYYKGLPLSQDMESGQMIRSVQLAAALNPKLRCILIDNAERLLDGKMAELNDWAEKNDYQIIAFRAAKEATGCEFYLENGKVQK